MGRSAIPHVVVAIAALICGTILSALNHPDQAYVAFGLVGASGIAAAAITIPAGTPGTAEPLPLAGILQAAYKVMGEPGAAAAAAAPASSGVRVVPPPEAPAPPPPAGGPPLSTP